MATTQRSTGPRQLSPRVEIALGAIGLVALVVIWYLASATGALSPNAVPSPGVVAMSFIELLGSGEFWGNLAATLVIALSGLVIVVLIAVPLAMAIHRSKITRESTWFVIEFLKPIPPVALIPLTILLWGPTKTVELTLVVFAALWPFLTQLGYGLREVSGVAIDVSHVYRLTAWQRARDIIIPSLTPFAMTGLRISITLALVTSIVTEYIVGIPGLGAQLAKSQAAGALDTMYGLIVAMGLLGIGLNAALAALQKPVLFWHPSQRERAVA